MEKSSLACWRLPRTAALVRALGSENARNSPPAGRKVCLPSGQGAVRGRAWDLRKESHPVSPLYPMPSTHWARGGGFCLKVCRIRVSDLSRGPGHLAQQNTLTSKRTMPPIKVKAGKTNQKCTFAQILQL